MGVVNRTLDSSEQNKAFSQVLTWGVSQIIPVSSTLLVGIVPFNSTLKAAALAIMGASGAPTYGLNVQRFIVGTGNTVITGGATTLTAGVIGTSGVINFVLAASGSSILNLLTNDVLYLTTGGANTAATQVVISWVLQATQDIKSQLGAT